MAYKRKTKKTGDTTKITTTQRSGKSTRITHSKTSSLGGNNKRTYSWSWSKGGRLRQTTTDNVNGWINRKSKTLGSPRRRSGGGRRKGSKGDDLLLLLILWILFLPFKIGRAHV